jgi:hypothetical protein
MPLDYETLTARFEVLKTGKLWCEWWRRQSAAQRCGGSRGRPKVRPSTVLPTGACRPAPWLPDGGDTAATGNLAVRVLTHVLGGVHILPDRDLSVLDPGLPTRGDLHAAHQALSRSFSVSL